MHTSVCIAPALPAVVAAAAAAVTAVQMIYSTSACCMLFRSTLRRVCACSGSLTSATILLSCAVSFASRSFIALLVPALTRWNASSTSHVHHTYCNMSCIDAD
jgi:hypothetical protein